MTVYLQDTWKVECPRCKAQPGAKCVALRAGIRKKGGEVMSHSERWKAAARYAAEGEAK